MSRYAAMRARGAALLGALQRWVEQSERAGARLSNIETWRGGRSERALNKLRRRAAGRAMIDAALMRAIDCLVTHKARQRLADWRAFVTWDVAAHAHAAGQADGITARFALHRWGRITCAAAAAAAALVAAAKRNSSCARCDGVRRWARRANSLRLARAAFATADARRVRASLRAWRRGAAARARSRLLLWLAERAWWPAGAVQGWRAWCRFAAGRAARALVSHRLRCRHFSLILAKVRPTSQPTPDCRPHTTQHSPFNPAPLSAVRPSRCCLRSVHHVAPLVVRSGGGARESTRCCAVRRGG